MGRELPIPSKEHLERLYLQTGLTPSAIAKREKVGTMTVRRWLTKLQIPIRRPYTSYVVSNLSTLECAYLAGYLDGDGTINVGLSRRLSSRNGLNIHCEVSLITKNKNFAEALHKMVGGKVTSFIYHDSRGKKNGYRLGFLNQASALAFLEQILPYLILKKKQAELMISFVKERLEARRMKGNAVLISDTCWEYMRQLRRLNDGKQQKVQI